MSSFSRGSVHGGTRSTSVSRAFADSLSIAGPGRSRAARSTSCSRALDDGSVLRCWTASVSGAGFGLRLGLKRCLRGMAIRCAMSVPRRCRNRSVRRGVPSITQLRLARRTYKYGLDDLEQVFPLTAGASKLRGFEIINAHRLSEPVSALVALESIERHCVVDRAAHMPRHRQPAVCKPAAIPPIVVKMIRSRRSASPRFARLRRNASIWTCERTSRAGLRRATETAR
jgi:hypothetical protein